MPSSGLDGIACARACQAAAAYLLPLVLELLPEEPLEPGVLGVALLLPLGLVLLELLPMPELPLPELPELLDEGAAPEGAGAPPAGGVAPGMVEEDEDPEGEAPDEDEDEDSPPAGGVEGVALGVLGAAGVLELLLGVEGVVVLELELEPGVAEVPALPPDSLLQPASSAARMLAASRTLEGWVSFIVRSFSK